MLFDVYVCWMISYVQNQCLSRVKNRPRGRQPENNKKNGINPEKIFQIRKIWITEYEKKSNIISCIKNQGFIFHFGDDFQWH